MNAMANRTGGPHRYRPVGGWRRQTAALGYSPRSTGCPAVERAIEGLYRGQNEESFWALMSALNYATELETRVLVPVQATASAHGVPAPWVEHPIPDAKAASVPLWTLHGDKGQTWLPLFTSDRAALASRTTSNCPMVEKTLQAAMELALESKEIDGVVLNPWGHSATLDSSLLNGLLRAQRSDDDAPGQIELEAGRTAARIGDWTTAAKQYQAAADAGRGEALTLLGECCYWGRGVRRSRSEARRLWTLSADAGEVLSMVALGDDCARTGNMGKALVYYRRAQQHAQLQPDIEYTPRICLRIAQNETRYLSGKQLRAAAMAAEAAQGFRVLQAEGDPDAALWLAEAEALATELAGGAEALTDYENSLQLD